MNAALLALFLVAPPAGGQPPPEAGPMPRVARERREGAVSDFSLTERGGRRVTLDDLAGKVWVASFVVTRCPDGKCPAVTRTVQRLQKELANRRDVLLVTFTTDPKDDPDELARYATAHDADPDRWLFLTGSPGEIDELLRSFRLRGPANKIGDTDHAQKLIVVDKKGEIRGYYDGMDPGPAVPEGYFENNLRELKAKVDEVRKEDRSNFPGFNAFLNGVAACLIFGGWLAIKGRLVRLHTICMVSALAVSALFLASYLYYHIVVKKGEPTRFADMAPDAPGWLATTYGAVLISHTLLAVFATPMALVSAYLGWRDRLRGHVRLARWTLPIWLYVSVTGVVVYWMLYRLY